MPTSAYLPTWIVYQAAWSDLTDAERQYLLASSVAEDCVYTDPTTQRHGRDGLAAFVRDFQVSYPGDWFANQEFAGHHAQVLASWTMFKRDGEVDAVGTSYARYGEDGRLTHMTGFFALPETPDSQDSHLATWKTYQSAWADVSPDERLRLLSASVAANCVYTDPEHLSYGLAELVGVIEQAQAQSPGASFENTVFLTHHDQALGHWAMLDGDGVEVAQGTSYARYGEDGRLTHMTGFPGTPLKVG